MMVCCYYYCCYFNFWFGLILYSSIHLLIHFLSFSITTTTTTDMPARHPMDLGLLASGNLNMIRIWGGYFFPLSFFLFLFLFYFISISLFNYISLIFILFLFYFYFIILFFFSFYH